MATSVFQNLTIDSKHGVRTRLTKQLQARETPNQFRNLPMPSR